MKAASWAEIPRPREGGGGWWGRGPFGWLPRADLIASQFPERWEMNQAKWTLRGRSRETQWPQCARAGWKKCQTRTGTQRGEVSLFIDCYKSCLKLNNSSALKLWIMRQVGPGTENIFPPLSLLNSAFPEQSTQDINTFISRIYFSPSVEGEGLEVATSVLSRFIGTSRVKPRGLREKLEMHI